jgi:hypothetical protein
MYHERLLDSDFRFGRGGGLLDRLLGYDLGLGRSGGFFDRLLGCDLGFLETLGDGCLAFARGGGCTLATPSAQQ